MKKLGILFGCIILLNCMSLDQKNYENQDAILLSSNYGGWEKEGFTVITHQEELDKIIKNSSPDEQNNSLAGKYKIPANSKILFYNFGQRNGGNHCPESLKNIRLEKEVLHLDVTFPQTEKYQIMAIANPWMMVIIPDKYEFKSVELQPITH